MTDKKFLKLLGERVLGLRTEMGMTQKKLAKKLRTQYPMIIRIEQGKVNCTINTLRRLAKALQVDITELINVK